MNSPHAITEYEMQYVNVIARRMCRNCPWLLEDVRQDGLLGLVQSAGKYDASQQAKFTTFAHAKIVWDVTSSLKRMPSVEPLTVMHPSYIDAGFKQVEDEEAIEAIRKIVQTLPPKDRRAFGMYYFEGMTMVAIGKKTRRSFQAVQQRIRNVEKLVRRRLGVS